MHPANRDDDHPGVAARHLPPTEDAWPTLVSSRHPVGVVAAAGREVRRVDPKPRRARGRMSIAASICVALAGSAGAVSAVNATLFPSLGRPTNESVWQNPGKVPESAAVPEPTTPRATRVVVVDPTSALVASVEVVVDLAEPATSEPATSEVAPPSTLDEIVAARPAIRTPAAVSVSAGSGSGGSVPGATSTQPPTTNSSDHATTSTTDRGGVQGPDTTADTAPHATDGSVPSNTAGSIPDDDGSSGNGSGKGGSSGKGGG